MDASEDSSSWPNSVRKFKFDVRGRSVMVRWRSLSIPKCYYNFLYMPFLCVFCGYRAGINLGVHNKAEGNLEIKKHTISILGSRAFWSSCKIIWIFPSTLTHAYYILNFFHIAKKTWIFYLNFYHINGCCAAPVNSCERPRPRPLF